jgi:hypothetical protein
MKWNVNWLLLSKYPVVRVSIFTFALWRVVRLWSHSAKLYHHKSWTLGSGSPLSRHALSDLEVNMCLSLFSQSTTLNREYLCNFLKHIKVSILPTLHVPVAADQKGCYITPNPKLSPPPAFSFSPSLLSSLTHRNGGCLFIWAVPLWLFWNGAIRQSQMSLVQKCYLRFAWV